MTIPETVQKSSQSPLLKTSLLRPIVAGWLAFVILFVVCGSWLAMASIDGAVISSGTVVVEGERKSIQHADGGVVTAILVEDGQRVLKGAELIRLDDTLLAANMRIYESRLREAIAKQSRLFAEQAGWKTIKWDRSLLAELDVQHNDTIEAAQARIFRLRSDFLNSQEERMKSKVAQFQNQIEGVDAQQNSVADQLDLANEELGTWNYLRKKGHVAEAQLREMKQKIASLDGKAGEAIAARARIKNSIEEIKIERLQETNEFRKEVSASLVQTDLEIQTLSQQLVVTRTMLNRISVRAPVAGIVHELAAHTIGGVLQAGATVLQIVPEGRKLEIEITVDPQFIDELFVGQETGVRMTALNLRTTPELVGVVTTISPDSVTDEISKRSYYRAKVSVSDQELETLGDVALLPGMPVEVFAKTGERSPIEYLLQPLTNQLTHAMREQ
ncbi:MAG: HlyD family type I secretion periplasmic adaptor subunit [Hyphomicrobiales bacterium]